MNSEMHNQVSVINVTAGIILKQNKILIAQRRFDDELGGLWEFPGGKTEPGETLPECLIREIFEELNIQIEVQKYLISLDQNRSNSIIRIHFFLCQFRGGRPEPRGVQDWNWISFKQFSSFEFIAGDQLVIEQLPQLLNTTLPGVISPE